MNSRVAGKVLAQPGALQGQNLRVTLKRAGITKWRLSKDCGISYRTIQYWEKGTSVPSKKFADKVAIYLGMTIPSDDGHADILKRLSAIEAQLGISEGRKT